jgi:hypothetical protein
MIFSGRASVFIFIVWCLLAQDLRAQKIYARISDDTVRLGESFTLTVVVEELDGIYTTPSLPGFKLTGQTKNRSIDYARGIVRNIFTYSLQAYRVGSFRIEPATLRSGKKTFYANELQVYVKADERRKEVFMRVVPSKRKVIVGECISADVKLYRRLDIEVSRMTDFKPPTDANNFWLLRGPWDEIDEESTETIDGMTYSVFTIHRDFLYPNTPGLLAIGSYSGTYHIREKTQQSDGGYTVSGKDILLETDNEIIEALPHPETGKPEDFKGDVGRFNMMAEISAAKVNAGDGFTVKVSIDGDGLFLAMFAPELKFPADFEISAPSVKDNTITDLSGQHGRKEFSYTVIAQKAGKYQLPGLRFVYFDPQTQAYVTRETPVFSLEVLPADVGKPSSTDYSDEHVFDEKKSSGLFFLCIGLIFLGLVAVFIFYRLRQSRKVQEQTITEETDELPVAEVALPIGVISGRWKKELHAAELHLQRGDGVQVARLGAHALLLWMCEQTGLGEAEASVENIRYRYEDSVRLGVWLALRERCGLAQYMVLSKADQELLLDDIGRFLSV